MPGENGTSRLRRWRLDMGYTLEEVADVTGVSISMLSRVERGLRNPSPDARIQMSRRLGVPVRDLFKVDDLPVAEGAHA